MKTAKFLTALAMASMFVACVEDLAPVENHKQGMDEVVGGEIIGTDVSMNVPAVGAETKFAGGQANWDSEDKLGMGWIVSGTVDVDQSPTVAPTSDVLYANHLFKGNNGVLSSYGNLYKGWHFVYFPYAYMEKVEEMPELANLNPAQTVNLVNEDGKMHPENYAKRFAQKFHVSALHFLTKESLEVEDGYKLREEVDITPVTPLVELIFSIAPAEGSAFATDVNLKEYKINSIKLAIPGAARFATKANLIPSKLHQYKAAEDVDNKAELKKSFAEAFNFTYVNNMTVDVSEVGYTVGSKAVAIAYTMPYTGIKNLSGFKNRVQIVVSTDKGDFTIKYKAPSAGQELAAWESANNAAIEALIAAYKPDNAATTDVNEGGVMTKWGASNTMKLQLHEDYFGIDWTVADEKEWEAKYELAKAMKLVNPTFELVEDADLNLSEVNIPEAGVTVKGEGTLTVDNDMSWNEAITLQENVQVAIAAEKTLTVSGTLAPKAIVNNGTIDAQAKAVLANLTNNGEVKVAYGAQVYPVAGKEGTISHVVDQLDIDNPTRIAYLTAVGAEPDEANKKFYANVNTLVVNEGFELDFNKDATTPGTPSDNDPYQPSTGTPGRPGSVSPYGEDFTAINFVINGGSIKSSVGDEAVKNVTMNGGNVGSNITMSSLTIEGGENTVEATAINGDVTVEAGEGTITVTGDIAGNVTVKGNYDVNAKNVGGYVNVTGEGNINVIEGIAANVTIGESSKYNVNAKSIAGNVTANGAGTFNVTEKVSGTFDATGNYTVNAAEITGNVTAKGNNSFLNVKKFGGNLTLTQTSDASTLNGNEVAGDVTLNGAFDVHNVTAKNMKISGAVKFVEKCTISGNMTNAAKNNVVVVGTKIAGDFTNSGKATLQNTTVGGVLTNESEVVISGETTVGSIVNNGTLTSSVDLHVIDVTLNEGSTTVLSSNGTKWDRTIWYTGKYVFDQMTLKGTVVQVNAAQLTADINAAIAAAANGTPQTVTLKGDVTLDEALTFTAPVTRAAAGEINVEINLNGYTIENKVAANTTKLGNVADECIVFYVDGEGMNLTIDATNGGKVIATGDGKKSDYNVAVWAANGAKVTIKGGEYYNKPDTKGDGCDLIYARGGASIFVEGGTFMAGKKRSNLGGGTYAVLNCKDNSNSVITVSGGKFYRFGSLEASRVGNGEVVLVEGYEWTTEADTDGYYSVVAK